jgi:hypothetical protein
MQHPGEAILNPAPEILHDNGTFEPVTFAVIRKREGSGRTSPA